MTLYNLMTICVPICLFVFKPTTQNIRSFTVIIGIFWCKIF